MDAMSKAESHQSAAAPADTDDEPAIEDDLIKEELRIDGICGVY